MGNIIYIASTNPVKIQATKQAFGSVLLSNNYQFIGVNAESGVNHQPMNDEETYKGAVNRVEYIFRNYPDGVFWIGIEGGIEQVHNEMSAFAWIVVKSRKFIGKSRTATFPLPPGIIKLIEKGIELGDADDKFFKRLNSKHQDGTVGFLTNGLIERKKYYEHAIILALIPFLNESLYK